MKHLRQWWNTHPNLFSWALLAVGMIIIVVIAARNVGVKPGQWAALLGATVALAGLCVWIIGWEDHDDEETSLLPGEMPHPDGTSHDASAAMPDTTPEATQPNRTTVERS
jgi:hypothetical protein